MQIGACKSHFGRVSLAAALLVCLAQTAQAQNYNEYYGQRQAGVTQVSHDTMLADIEARLAALESASGVANVAEDGTECKEVDIISKPTHKFRGRMFFDQLWMDDLEGAVPQPLENETGFDTIRMGVEGYIYENLKYSVEFEFEGDEVDYKDVYAELQNLPYIGNFRIGHFKEPMGLEELTSSRFDTFMEQSCPTNNFAPTRNLGIMLHNYVGAGENWKWFAGLFRGSSSDMDEDVDADSNDWAGTFRFAGLPYYDEYNGRCLVHVGAAASARRTGEFGGVGGNGAWDGSLELDSRASLLGITLGNPPLGAPRSSSEFGVLNLEGAFMRGPFSLQGEWFYAATGDTAGINANGAYVQASYFLTGENRGYKKSNMAFDRVHPYEPFFRVRTCDGIATGIGAWELAARWSWCDLDSIPALIGTGVTTVGPTVIGTQENIALGCNWYLNPYSRVMFNYIHSITDYTFLGKSEGDHFGMRFQIDW